MSLCTKQPTNHVQIKPASKRTFYGWSGRSPASAIANMLEARSTKRTGRTVRAHAQEINHIVDDWFIKRLQRLTLRQRIRLLFTGKL